MKRKVESRCATCIYSRDNPKFHYDLVRCSYFNVNSLDTIIDVMRKHRCPLKVLNVQRHCKNHLLPKMRAKDKSLEVALGKQADSKAVVGELVKSGSYHESVALKTVKKFEQLLDDEQIKITAKDGLSAIRLLADIEKSNKDRGADLFKTMFKGADGVRQSEGS